MYVLLICYKIILFAFACHMWFEQVPAIVLLKTVVILTISGQREEKTVGIKCSYFIPVSRLIINNVKTHFGPQMKIAIPSELLNDGVEKHDLSLKDHDK